MSRDPLSVSSVNRARARLEWCILHDHWATKTRSRRPRPRIFRRLSWDQMTLLPDEELEVVSRHGDDAFGITIGIELRP